MKQEANQTHGATADVFKQRGLRTEMPGHRIGTVTRSLPANPVYTPAGDRFRATQGAGFLSAALCSAGFFDRTKPKATEIAFDGLGRRK